MKKFLSISICLLFLLTGMDAQYTTPRFGTTPSSDNTGRSLTYKYAAPVFSSTVTITANAFETIVKVGKLTGAQTDTAVIARCHLGDRLTILYLADTANAGRVVTFGANFVSDGTLTVADSKKASVSFIFDGVAWIETSRFIE